MRARHRRHARVEEIPGYRWRGGGYEDVDSISNPPMTSPATRTAQISIEQMIRAVGRFPPLPQWVQGTSMQLVLKLRFPDALLR